MLNICALGGTAVIPIAHRYCLLCSCSVEQSVPYIMLLLFKISCFITVETDLVPKLARIKRLNVRENQSACVCGVHYWHFMFLH